MGIAENITTPLRTPRTQAADTGYLEGLSPRAGGIHKGAKALRRLRVPGTKAKPRSVKCAIASISCVLPHSNSRQSLKVYL